MSEPPRLQVQAGGAFLSRVNVLRVMSPVLGAQVRILAPAGLGYEALAWGSAGQKARAARAPGGQTGPAGSRRQPPQPRGSAVKSQGPGAATSPPQPASGAGRCNGVGWAGSEGRPS